MNQKVIGNLGEKIAESYLKKKGYQILEKNYSFRIPGSPQKGEIDIIAKKDDIISFIEVKTLQCSNFFILPEEKVNYSKRKKLIIVAESWLIKNKISLNSKWQIDVIGIKIKNGKAKISHFENVVAE